jgi:hypothetical protein
MDGIGCEQVGAQGSPLPIEATRDVGLCVAISNQLNDEAIALDEGSLASDNLALKRLKFLFPR